jgi:cyclopropane fatty-acyl-phospholipid synthase-like methyltransferase
LSCPNGKRLDVEADDENAALTGAQGWYKQNVTDKTDTSVGGTLQQGLLDIGSGVGKTVKEYVNKDAGNAMMGAVASKADPKYKPHTRASSILKTAQQALTSWCLDWKQGSPRPARTGSRPRG